MRKFTDTITKSESSKLGIVTQAIESAKWHDKYTKEIKVNYRRGIVSLVLRDSCIRKSDGRPKSYIIIAINSLVKSIREKNAIDVAFSERGSVFHSVDIVVNGYHKAKTVVVPKQYGNGTLGSVPKKITRLAVAIKELWLCNRFSPYAMTFKLHDGDKVVKCSGPEALQGYFRHTFESVDAVSMMAAGAMLGGVHDVETCEYFVPDSVTISDGDTGDQYEIKL